MCSHIQHFRGTDAISAETFILSVNMYQACIIYIYMYKYFCEDLVINYHIAILACHPTEVSRDPGVMWPPPRFYLTATYSCEIKSGWRLGARLGPMMNLSLFSRESTI